MKFKLFLILIIYLNKLFVNNISNKFKDISNKIDINDSIDTNYSLNNLNRSFDNSINKSLSLKGFQPIDNLFNKENIFYEIKDKEDYKQLQKNYYDNEKYEINIAINNLYTLSCKKAFKKWLKIFNNEKTINIKACKREYNKKLNNFCNNFELILKNRYKYFKEYQENNHHKLNLLRLTQFSWFTDEEFNIKYLSENNKLKSKFITKTNIISKKKRVSIISKDKNSKNINKKKNKNKNEKQSFKDKTKYTKNYLKSNKNINYDIIELDILNKDFDNYSNPLKSYVFFEEDNKLIRRFIEDTNGNLQPLVNPKYIKLLNHIPNTNNYHSYLGEVENQGDLLNCWSFSSMVLARAYSNIYLNNDISKDSRMSYSRIVDCFDDSEFISNISTSKLFESMKKFGFSFENNYPNNYKVKSNKRHNCLANKILPDIEFKEIMIYNTKKLATYDYQTITITIQAALKALEYGPYISSLYVWPGFGNCEKCSNPPQCYDTNHSVIVYKIYNGEVYFRNSWGKEWGINGNGSIKAEYTKKSTIFPRKACNLLDYVAFPSIIKKNKLF